MPKRTIATILEVASRMPKPPKIPAVGDGATHGYGGDRYPGTVTAVEEHRGTVIVTVHGDDHYFDRERGEHVYTPSMRRGYANWRLDIIHDSEGCPRAVWQRVYANPETGRWNKSGRPGGIGFGFREYDQDPSF